MYTLWIKYLQCLKVWFTNWHMIAHMKQNFIQTSDMLLFASVSFWLNRNKGKYGKKIRPIGYKFMRLWLQKLTQVTTITYDVTRISCEGSSISCEIIRLQFHATVSVWYTQQIYASNCGKRFLSKSCVRFTILVVLWSLQLLQNKLRGQVLWTKPKRIVM